ncbi:MAG TPA: FAD binding domain-containing protein [Sphaerochaeta sp.]|nr:FAD binding domain-containing protein [Spirochaetota bacterium]NLV61695.1 molybdopterin dehydrogenase [Spirochaetales bacterium]HOE84466.1 FAD binding domain-containing protein [Sphaerochaeta sp.]HOQ94233.1 FAD binding domain-containing protein [Sphaerochaeta sp.]HPK47067.1 FAD binding domain-containing protein [Sphaerochaeta sp.]
MFEGVRSPLIYTPRSLSEFATVIGRHPQAILWAGGTYLMSRSDYYPTEARDGIIDLSYMEELKRITRTDRYVEIGAMVTARQLLSAGRLLLPPILQQTLSSIGTQIVRRQVTVGGSLCISDARFSLSTTLAILAATAEVKRYDNGKVTTHWIPIAKLYEKDGKLNLGAKNALLTRIRIGLEFGDFQRFVVFGDPIRRSDECGIVALQAKREQNGLSKVQFCVTFPGKAFHISKDIESKLSGSALPIHPEKVNILSHELVAELTKMHSTISELQLERARRIFESFLHDLNSQSLL